MATITARELNRDVSAAKRAAADGPVFVTDRGRPAFVLMTIEDYRRSLGDSGSRLLDRLAMSEDEFVDDDVFVPAQVRLDVPDL